MDGMINVFKPRGITSHDVVNRLRKILGTKKIGHTGTLDPNASGVLPICIGKATRISEYLLDSSKEYISELTLGYETDTQDEDGIVTNASSKTVENEDIVSSISSFRGEIMQIPPMYSALKVKGRKLYELAREGKTIDRAPRQVTIYNIDILDIIDNRKIVYLIECSRGTYIRTLCDDIGKKLGTYGYMSYLIRTRVGNFKIEDSVSLEKIEHKKLDNKLEDILISIDMALDYYPKVIISEKLYKQISNGVIIPLNEENNESYDVEFDIYRVYCKNDFIGLGKIVNEENNKLLKMDKVLLQGDLK